MGLVRPKSLFNMMAQVRYYHLLYEVIHCHSPGLLLVVQTVKEVTLPVAVRVGYSFLWLEVPLCSTNIVLAPTHIPITVVEGLVICQTIVVSINEIVHLCDYIKMSPSSHLYAIHKYAPDISIRTIIYSHPISRRCNKAKGQHSDSLIQGNASRPVLSQLHQHVL